MTALFADRFLRVGPAQAGHHRKVNSSTVDASTVASGLSRIDCRAIDLATGDRVSLRVSQSGTRVEQQAWADACGRVLGVSRSRRLIDFGLVGSDQRFEAYQTTRHQMQAASTIAMAPMPSWIVQALEWLEDATMYSSRILSLPHDGDGGLEVLAREVRLRGFIPVNLALFDRHRKEIRDLARLFKGRSVVVLGEGSASHPGPALSEAFLRLIEAPARGVSAIVFTRHQSGVLMRQISDAAEGRAVYEARRSPLAPTGIPPIPLIPVINDARAAALFGDGRRQMGRGRHAAAERAFRAAAAAFERRRDVLHAGDAALELGQLLLTRGRATEAQSQFESARVHFQQVGAAEPAVTACVFVGLAQTDTALHDAADTTLRAAYSAACALKEQGVVQAAVVALARNLYWQGRHAEAIRLLEQAAPDQCPRYWTLMCRLHLAVGHLDAACQCLSRAREGMEESDGLATEALVRNAQAMVQARLGDVDALSFHARLGLIAARRSHLPLQALRLRLTLIDGLLDAGLLARARAIGKRARTFERASLPALLSRRFERVRERLEQGGRQCPRVPVPAVHEQAPAFHLSAVDGVTELLQVCRDVEDERDALNGTAALVRKQAYAAAVGIFGLAGSSATPLGVAGQQGSLSAAMAGRCADLGLAIAPERTAAGVEAAVPIHHLGRTMGAIALRWTVDGPGTSQDVLAFARVAAAACSPLVQILLERHAGRHEEAPPDGLELIGVSAAMQEVRRLIVRAANAPFTVLIEGESGSGKELVARAIHRTGCRREHSLCALNCAALSEELVDTELFGHAKGAFTGAATERLGLFEAADGGTVFLDEVGELSPRAQAKLLRVLQEGEIRRIGENFTRPIDARLIAATNRALRAEVEAGRFRQDLLYRLDVIRMTVPPLRERVEDIPLLARRFWREAAERIGTKAVLGQGALSALARYDWPGNVRELQNVLTALAVSASSRGVIAASAMPAAIAHAMTPTARETLDAARHRFERRFVRAALARAAGHRGQTAAELGVSRQGLAKLMQRLQVEELEDG